MPNALKPRGQINKRYAGRPTKYDPTFVLKTTRKYIDRCGISYERVLESKKKRSVMYSHKPILELPMLEGLALDLHIHVDTIYEWRKIHAEFSELVSEMLQKQAKMLANNSLMGDFNPMISKVFLTKHGYREGVEHANPDGTNLFRPSDAERAAAAKALDGM